MKDRIEIWIGQAEESWLTLLSVYSEALFSNKFLPSHDHTHHRRVWNISKSLLREIATFNSLIDPTLVEGVLIASFFHDLGMVKSTQEDHGRLGRELCEVWFDQNPHIPPQRYDEVLGAIELHDIKEHSVYSPLQPGARPGVLSILSIADDLEAMGTIGVYRYAEIYLQRNIPMNELGIRILNNAGVRFGNLELTCARCPAILEYYRQQYDQLVAFYSMYNKELESALNPLETFEGYVGVVNYIRTLGLEKNTRPEYLSEAIGLAKKDGVVKDFFSTLKNELDQERL